MNICALSSDARTRGAVFNEDQGVLTILKEQIKAFQVDRWGYIRP